MFGNKIVTSENCLCIHIIYMKSVHPLQPCSTSHTMFYIPYDGETVLNKIALVSGGRRNDGLKAADIVHVLRERVAYLSGKN